MTLSGDPTILCNSFTYLCNSLIRSKEFIWLIKSSKTIQEILFMSDHLRTRQSGEEKVLSFSKQISCTIECGAFRIVKQST